MSQKSDSEKDYFKDFHLFIFLKNKTKVNRDEHVFWPKVGKGRRWQCSLPTRANSISNKKNPMAGIQNDNAFLFLLFPFCDQSSSSIPDTLPTGPNTTDGLCFNM